MSHVTATHRPTPRPTWVRDFTLGGLRLLTLDRLHDDFPGKTRCATILEGLVA